MINDLLRKWFWRTPEGKWGQSARYIWFLKRHKRTIPFLIHWRCRAGFHNFSKNQKFITLTDSKDRDAHWLRGGGSCDRCGICRISAKDAGELCVESYRLGIERQRLRQYVSPYGEG